MDNKETPSLDEPNVGPADQTKEAPDALSTSSNAGPDVAADTQKQPDHGSVKSVQAQEVCPAYQPKGKPVSIIPWSPEDLKTTDSPPMDAPYITGGDATQLTGPELIAGIYVNIPRSPRLWTGDQLKVTWGYNTFYSTITESTSRKGPRQIQYLNSEELAQYADGEVYVQYEVVRGNRLIGISEKLKVTLKGTGNGRARNPNRRHGIRRRKLPF
jgi:hypothetical protein